MTIQTGHGWGTYERYGWHKPGDEDLIFKRGIGRGVVLSLLVGLAVALTLSGLAGAVLIAGTP